MSKQSKTIRILGLFVSPLLITGCLCSAPPTDEERLLKKIDATPVHLYVASKVAITEAEGNPDVTRARDQMVALIETFEAAVESDTDSDSTPGPGEKQNLSPKEMLALGKAVWGLKQAGADIVRGNKGEVAPVLPVFLRQANVDDALIQLVDLPTEHALFYVVLTALKVHEKSPVPIPVEILLYEAWHTNPEGTRIPGVADPLHALKAWTYGSNDFCDLALAEAEATEKTTLSGQAFMKDFNRITQTENTDTIPSLEQVDAAGSALGYGSHAYCHLARGDDQTARPSLKKFTEYTARTGLLAESEMAYLNIFYLCGGDDDEVKQGREQLTRIRTDQVAATEDYQVLEAYCDASDETTMDTARKVLFAGKILDIASRSAEKAHLDESMEGSMIFGLVRGFANTFQTVAPAMDGVSKSLDDLKNGAQGLLNKK